MVNVLSGTGTNKKFLSGIVTATLVVLLAFTDLLVGTSSLPAANAADSPTITLNGTAAVGDPGVLDSKAVMLSTGGEAKVNYRLVPGYSTGSARGITVTLYMPSLEYVDGEYRVVDRDRPATKLGVQGRVSSSGNWVVKSNTTVQGGPIVMEYTGQLNAGVNPAFDVFLTTYGDGTDGPYGSVPEGTSFEVNGFVSYKQFNAVDAPWETPRKLDDASRISVISSNLTWDTSIQSRVPQGESDLVPIWDRYQYIDYTYAIENTSTNLASNIDGYTATFDIDSTATGVNGIIPFDINRWTYNEGAAPTENTDQNQTDGKFVGVPGKGGVLIYDITDWDGKSKLTEEIPYTYSGGGMIMIDREHGDARQGLTPEGAKGQTKHEYLLSLPLSRQGFANPPAMFKIKAITNVLFAKSANWSKTRVVEREIARPTFSFEGTHTPKSAEVVYGYDTHTEIAQLKNSSNAPVFNTRVEYQADPDYNANAVEIEVDKSQLERFEKASVSFDVVDKETGDTVARKLAPTETVPNEAAGTVVLRFDLAELSGADAADWSHKLTVRLVDQLEAHEALPAKVRVLGAPTRVGDMSQPAKLVYVEKIASNDDFGNNTTYTEQEHELALPATFKVIYPREVVPKAQVRIDGVTLTTKPATVKWGERAQIDFLTGTNDTVAQTSKSVFTLNTDAAALSEAELTLRAALFTAADNLRVSYTTLDDATPVAIELPAAENSADFSFALPKNVATVIVETDAFTSNGAQNFVSVSAKVANKLVKQHQVTAEVSTYQPKPYDKTAKATATGLIDIQLPGALNPVVDAVGVFGTKKTKTTTRVAYESDVSVEYQLDTRGVRSPESNYEIDMLAPTGAGQLEFKRFTVQPAYLDAAEAADGAGPTITLVDEDGNEQVVEGTTIAREDVTLKSVAKIVLKAKGLRFSGLTTIAVVDYAADIAMGTSQSVRATFAGTQEEPYEDTKIATAQNKIEVSDTKTQVKVEGVNQVSKAQGVGNEYSVDIYRWWGAGYTYSKQDYTLDQGYKSLGGFTSTITRPSADYDNNDQHVSVEVELPTEHFDLYYLKLRNDLKPYVESVDIYRTAGTGGKNPTTGAVLSDARAATATEQLWQSVPGTAWTENTSEGKGFWRINTARSANDGDALFATQQTGTAADTSTHPYYKGAWDADVRPDAPVSRVVVNLNFTRSAAGATPQLPGTQNDVIEYMGRFHSSSIAGKKPTKLTTHDTFGKRTTIKREATTSINSLVAYPFAQARTGANDNTSLANKVITMGSVGEYLASVWNVANASWSYYSGHGPDVYLPAATEYDEWLGLYDPASFHDRLMYEFVYPASPVKDKEFNLDAKYFTVENTSTLKYLTGVRVFDDAGESVEIAFDEPLTQKARFDYVAGGARGITADGDGTFSVALGTAGAGSGAETPRYPSRFEAVFEEVAGYGDRTAEIGGQAADSLGANLNEVDVRVGGVVNGNKALAGTSNLYRVPADTGVKTLMGTTSATLTGYTPKLGASIDMSYTRADGSAISSASDRRVYDYAGDGTTPNTTRVAVGVANTSEADITDVSLKVTPDTSFRARTIDVPAELFNGDWNVTGVTLAQGGKNHEIDPSLFELQPPGGAQNEAADSYELDLEALFAETPTADKPLKTEPVDVAFGGKSTLLKRHIDAITLDFEPASDDVRLYGSLANAEAETKLPTRMAEGGSFFVTGVWVDETANGSGWDSKPSFVAAGGKQSHDALAKYSNFSASGEVTPAGGFTVSAGGGNAGQKPALTHGNTVAPLLYSRVARLESQAVHLNNDLTRVPTPSAKLFFDADTGKQVSASNIAVGDTVKVLYQLRNGGTTPATESASGHLPVFSPLAQVQAPVGLDITAVEPVTALPEPTEPAEPGAEGAGSGTTEASAFDALVTEIATANGGVLVRPEAANAQVTRDGAKRADVAFDLALDDKQSVFFTVEFTATNDFTKTPALTDSQAKTATWSVFSRPQFTHHFMSYDGVGVTGHHVTGSVNATADLDGDKTNESAGLVANTAYRFANPTELRIESVFDRENISGESMTLTVKNARNELEHDNTELDLFITLDKTLGADKKSLLGFELGKLPAPAYPADLAGFTPEFAAPVVSFKDTNGEWVRASDFDDAKHKLADINELRVAYGTVPAAFVAPDFKIVGKGHWRTAAAKNTKFYDITSQARIRLTHKDEQNAPVAEYGFTHEATKRAYKAIPQLEFNAQSFGSMDEALAPYNGAALGKTGYRPGDAIFTRLTAVNHSNFQGVNTNTPYGKAPLKTPVVIDKIPEYLTTKLSDYVSGGELDVARAVADGVLSVRITGEDEAARDIKLPTATVKQVTGLDIAGAQQFERDQAGAVKGWGRLSLTQPTDTAKNPANTITFDVVTYTFEGEQLGRGEQLDIVYEAKARTNDLPVATYRDGAAVFAPFFGWYGANTPVSKTAAGTQMDMASLLHDAGLTGDRGHEMTGEELLSNSTAWQPGAVDKRRDPTNNYNTLQETYYDATANKQKSHQATLRETAGNEQYVSFTSTALDDTYAFASKGRVDDGKVKTAERILWAQDGLQLNRAWLYGASEIVPDTERKASGVDPANFYEHDGSLYEHGQGYYGYTPYSYDNYTYAVELHEEFTVKLHAANLGDRAIKRGLEYTEILPVGVSPYGEDGKLLGAVARDGSGAALAAGEFSYKVVQTPEDDKGFRAPAQSQEAGTFKAAAKRSEVPYVVRVVTKPALAGMYEAGAAAGTAAVSDKYQSVELRVRVAGEVAPGANDLSNWHDEFTLTSVEDEGYLEIYSAAYGAVDVPIGTWNKARYPNDGMAGGVDVDDLVYDFGSYNSYLAVEPWGMYVRGLNAQATEVADAKGAKPALVTGDQIAMRKPTLRVWSKASKTAESYAAVVDTDGKPYNETIQDFSVDLYEKFTIDSTIENQQLEATGEYNRVSSGYNTNQNNDIWVNAPQTIGGARGTWFEPRVSIALPYGVAPMLKSGKPLRYDDEGIKALTAADLDFTAAINAVTYKTSSKREDATANLDASVELVEDKLGKRFVLHFEATGAKAANVAYGQSLVVSPVVMTIDTPAYAGDTAGIASVDTDDAQYRELVTLASSKRPVFNPIVSTQYQTGSTPSLTARDQALGSYDAKSSNGLSITANDRTRRDSTSSFSSPVNWGALRITERLIAPTKGYDDETLITLNPGSGFTGFFAGLAWTERASALSPVDPEQLHAKRGAYGSTALNLRQPAIHNVTKATSEPGVTPSELVQVDAAGKYWYVTDVRNERLAHNNPYEQIKTAGSVHNSRFVVSQHVTTFAQPTGEAQLEIDGVRYDRKAFEAMGYDVKLVKTAAGAAGSAATAAGPGMGEGRGLVQWVVTTPANERGTLGELKSGGRFTLLTQMQLVAGFEDTTVADEGAEPEGGPVWKADELVVDAYVSLITDDRSLAIGAEPASEFIVQRPKSMHYDRFDSDKLAGFDIDGNGDDESVYAADDAEIEIRKPRATVRVNTLRPRLAYSNGLSGDTYFNSSDSIDYVVTNAKITGSGLKEFVVENVLPTSHTGDDQVQVSNQPIRTTMQYITTGQWQLPQKTLDRLEADGVSVDQAFKTYVYLSHEQAEPGYEAGDWKLLNPGGTSILENKRLEIGQADASDVQKIRVVVRAQNPDEYLVPRGTRLAVDADPATEAFEEVTETDPENHSTSEYPASVTDAAIGYGMRVSSSTKLTLFIYGTAQAWGNYVGTSVTKLAQSHTRSYLTPSRPVVNVKFTSLHFRPGQAVEPGEPEEPTAPEVPDPDAAEPSAPSGPAKNAGAAGADPASKDAKSAPAALAMTGDYGWSDITTISPKSLPHLKFSGEFINADESMWERDEDNVYAEDMLVDPFITFQLPSVLETGKKLTYVPQSRVAGTPLANDYHSEYSLTDAENGLWTWRLEAADGGEPNKLSRVSFEKAYVGPMAGSDRNVLTVGFSGDVMPGDKIVVDFIGSVNAYAPDAESLKSRALLTNNTGLLQPLNSRLNSANHLGYATDSADFNQNGLKNDRLVFSEKSLFQYEAYDDFGKRKVAFSDLNRAGTVAPELTPVREGGDFSFDVSVDNMKEPDARAYPYPIMYDVLPFLGDTSIVNDSIERQSKYQAWLDPESISLTVEGANPRVYDPSEYTVYAGPFTKQGGKIVDAEMVAAAETGKESFYDSLGLPGTPAAVRDAHFVPLNEIVAASGASDGDLVKRVKTLLVLLNDPKAELPGKNQLKLSYSMQAPINAPALLEQFDEQGQPGDVALWNSFMATQRAEKFLPQESNNAGVFAVEQRGKAYIGNYVWNDVNANGTLDEGTVETDVNGRELLTPTKDLDYDGEADDPGINGVKVSLLSAAGYNVDYDGNQIAKHAGEWVVVDDAGRPVLDDVFGKPVASEGPVTTLTESDIHGNAGYYTFSNIEPGEYRVMFELPTEFDAFSTTTTEVFKKTGLETFVPGEQAGVPAGSADERLVVVTDAANVTLHASDAERMSFDLGVAHTVKVGGTVFKESLTTLDGLQGKGEPGLEGYHVRLINAAGETVRDERGRELVERTDKNGHYEFTVLPRAVAGAAGAAGARESFTVRVSNAADAYDDETVVSPFVLSADPFERADDNDGFSEKGSRTVHTGLLRFDTKQLVTAGYADRMSIGVGFYDRSTTGVIGNRVWNDLNRDGVQDDGEPGIAGQKLRLEQYLRAGDGWELNAGFTQQATSNADGYYYFTAVPSTAEVAGKRTEARYQVVVDQLVPGFTFAPTHAAPLLAQGAELDSDFYGNGTMHDGAAGANLVSVVENIDGVDYGYTDNTIDLGLMAHARQSLEGAIFIDANGDGVNNDAGSGGFAAEDAYTAALEVRAGGKWQGVRVDAAGQMIEPAAVTDADRVLRLEGVSKYRFEGLHIVDSLTLERYEYRVRVDEIPLWQSVTVVHQGDDVTRDSDFTESARAAYFTAVSDTRVLGETQQQLIPVDTVTGVPVTHVDLGLVPLATSATIGDLVWHDADGDGLQGADEPGITGVPVTLYRLAAGELVPVEDTETDAKGRYEFTAPVAPQSTAAAGFAKPYEYVVGLNLSSRQSLTARLAGGDRDSKFVMLGDAESAGYKHSIVDARHTAVSLPVTLAEADADGFARFDTVGSNPAVDGGLAVHKTRKTIGDTAFSDLDRDGVQGDGEPGIPGLTASLYRFDPETDQWRAHADLNGASSVTTDGDGRYEFAVEVADLDKSSQHYREAWQYRVVLETPANLRLVEPGSAFAYTEAPGFPATPIEPAEPADPVDPAVDPAAPGAAGGAELQPGAARATARSAASGTQIAASDIEGIEIARPYSTVVSGVLTLVDGAAGAVDLATARSLDDVDAGFAVYADAVEIGGTVWNDTDLDGVRGDGEQPIAGRTVVLWELVEGEWVRASDLEGAETAVTDAAGDYRFTVAPAHYDESQADFLQPRQYRVSADREGYETWSPTLAGDDRALDSDAQAPAPEFGGAHTGVTGEFSLASLVTVPGVGVDRVDVTSTRDDTQMDMGLRVSPHTVALGGQVFNDTDLDGVRSSGEHALEGVTVTLWEKIGDEWLRAADATGATTAVTDARGGYAFEVEPAHYALDSASYLAPREYRTTIELPVGMRLSDGASAVAGAGLAHSVTGSLVTLDAAGLVDAPNVHDDMTLEFALAAVPVAVVPPLAVTGSGAPWGILGLGLGFAALGVVLAAGAGSRRRREQQQKSTGRHAR